MSDPIRVADQLQSALACWRGSAFEEFAEFDWARVEAVRLDELRANAREDLIDARLACGEHAVLVGELEALVADSPLRERLWRQLITALYRSGRSAEALQRASALRTVLREEVGLEPSPALRELEARVLNDDPTLLQSPVASRRATPRRLPAESTQLVGRADELSQLGDRLRTSRLLTLAGPGGVGKTRLALRLAGDFWDEFDGEVFVALLAPVHDPSSTVAAIATAVDVQQRQHLSIEETLLEYLRGRRALLVLDNCEHLRATVAPLADRLLGLCPEVSLLTTSREVLGLPGEQVWRVRPLEIAPQDASTETISEAPATRLFVERATAARPSFAPQPDDLRAIAEIVRRLDGLPLAIELAAARVGAMSPADLAGRLDQRFELLGGTQTSMVARHRTLQDLVAWSFDLLDAEEQRLFARLCVFAGSFGLDAAEGVCGDEDLSSSRISRLLANLVDKSMVQLVDENIPRYRVLETLRDFGNEQLDRRRTVQRSFAACPLVPGPGPALRRRLGRPRRSRRGRRRSTPTFDNLRSAHHWSLENADADLGLLLVAALREYAARCMHAEITSWADAAIAIPGADEHERFPVVVAVAAYGRFVRGDLEGAIELGDQAIAAAERLGVDCSGLAERTLGNAWFYRNDVVLGAEWMDRMIASARSGSAARLTHALYMRSVSFTSVGDNVKGAQYAGEARAAAAACGSPTAKAQALYALGLALESTDPEEAAAHLQRAADVALGAGNRWIQAFALTEVLWLQAREGQPREALERYSDVIEIWYRGGDWANQWLSLRHVFGILVQLRAYLGAATLHGALTAAGAAYALPVRGGRRRTHHVARRRAARPPRSQRVRLRGPARHDPRRRRDHRVRARTDPRADSPVIEVEQDVSGTRRYPIGNPKPDRVPLRYPNRLGMHSRVGWGGRLSPSAVIRAQTR